MNVCANYYLLSKDDKAQIDLLIKRIRGKSNIADIIIEDADTDGYDFKITVCKYSKSSSRGWATIGYVWDSNLRHVPAEGDFSKWPEYEPLWKLSYRPKGEKLKAGRTGSYG